MYRESGGASGKVFPNNRFKGDVWCCRTTRASSGPCAPGMARYFIGASPMARFSQSRRQGEGQGRRREAGSEGSPIRNCGAMDKNRI